MIKHRFDYFASCPVGLELVLDKELADLGIEKREIVRGGVRIECFHEVALRVILRSRIASRVFKFLYTFETNNEKDMYQQLCEVKWKSLMEVDQKFRLHTIFSDLPRERHFFTNSHFVTLKFKDAIVDYFRHYEGDRPSVAKDDYDISFLLRISASEDDLFKAEVLQDLCGIPLNERGYRVSQTVAPVKENLAAGILYLLDYQPEKEHFFDGMCGSGTFLIEAALIAGKIAPSFLLCQLVKKYPEDTPWSFLKTQWYKKDKYLMENFNKEVELINEETEKGMKKLQKAKFTIFGNDINEFSLISAKENLRRAKLDQIVKVTCDNILHHPGMKERTLFFANPPYGERMMSDEIEKVEALYHDMGELWKKSFKGSRAAIFTGHREGLKKIGLKSKKKHILFNGDIECRLAEYELF